MDRETNDLIARLYLGEKNLDQVEPRAFAEWGSLQLERGHDLNCIRQLAATVVTDYLPKLETKFKECIANLGWEIPKKKEVMKRHADSILHSIVDGTIEPYYGCSHLYLISIFLGHPDDLYTWDEIFWAREDLGIDKMNVLIMQEARRALGLDPPEAVEEEDDPFDEEDGDLLNEDDDIVDDDDLLDGDEPPTFWSRLEEILGLR